MNLAVRFNAR